MSRKAAVSLLLTAVCFQAAYSSPLRADDGDDSVIIESCPSPVYCQGKLLDTIQKARLFNDSKTFVDMSQVNPTNTTMENFRQLMDATDGNPTKDELRDFVTSNFINANETVLWTPPDYKSDPAIVQEIGDEKVREFAKNLIAIWPTIGRKTSPDVYEHPNQHSVIPVPNGFIVPGGRFRELYYWDSYWIVKGLLISEMHETARGMIENICSLIDRLGFMPNGGRLYYLNRSHPPLFTLMVKEYLKQTNDTEWVKSQIQCVEKELTFWLKNRTELVIKDGISYQLAHYGPLSNTPRPESYMEDIKTCIIYSNENDKRRCYRSLKSGAESGWDFSTRWFFDENGGINTNLSHVQAQRVVPVDLNAFLCRAFGILAEFYGIVGDEDKQALWQERSNIWKKSIERVFYNVKEGIWLDYDPVLEKHRDYFFPSNFAPLWAECYDLENRDEHGKNAAAYLLKRGVDQFLGGIPTSLDQSGEQWDLRNAWPPLQEIIVLGLLRTGNSNATELAKLFGERWVSANIIGYDETKIMFEKYDAVDPGKFGGGGEYIVQAGFGWTNGVALSFIDMFYRNK